MVRTLWLGAAAAVVLLGSGCNCNNTPFTDGDAGTGGGSSAGGGTTATGGSAATGGGTAATGGGTAATGGGTAATGGGTAATGGGTAATGGGTAATGGGTAATGGGTAATGGGTAATGGGTAATGGGTAATGGGTAATGGGTAATGGGTAAMGGGSATGGGTTTSCTGAATNTYVCQTCTGAADSNTGTSDCPALTIGQGIANASALHLPTVFIASASGSTTATYTEDLTVPDGVTLQGKWSATTSSGGFTWARTAGRTAVVNMLPEGLRFAAAAGTTSGIDGLQVTVVRPGSSMFAAAFGINVATASPTLIDFAVIGSSANGTLPGIEYGISVIGGTTRSAPVIGSASIASAIGSIRAVTQAEGLHIENSAATVTNVDITEVAGGTLSIGTRLIAAANTKFTTGRSNALTGASCFGVFSTGDSSGVVFDGVNANGCGAGAIGANSQFSGGVVFDNCPALTPGSAPPVFKNSTTVTGGAVVASPAGPNTTPLAVGVMATDGCSLQVTGNTSITGALNGSGTTAAAYGVLCSFQGVTRMVGVDSPCTISTNTSIVGSNAAVVSSVGIACAGTCLGSDSTCKGSCAQISDNKPGQQGGGVSAGSGTSQYALLVQESDPTVLRNSFAPAATTGTTTGCTNGWGALLVGAGGTYENNLFAGPDCSTTNNPTAIGVQLNAEQRKDGNFASPLFHSNTILSFVAAGISPIGPLTQAAVALIAVQGGGTQATIGSFYNNILQIGPLGLISGNSSPSYVFEESSNKVAPVTIQTNDFFVSGATVNPPFFLQDGSTGLTSMATVNAVPNVTLNVTLNPGFVAGSLPHISNTSAVKGQGTSNFGGPTDDYDGQPRPNPAGTNPDIGADEIGG